MLGHSRSKMRSGFFTLADVGDILEHRRKVYELNRITALDIPRRGPFFTFEEYNHLRFEQEAYCADGVILAAAGTTWVGLSQVSLHRVGNFMFNEMTGVLNEYRGYKIAQALKVLAARCARSYGVAELKTFNDSKNAPMLAINRKMGYQAEAGFYTLKAVFA